jgi:hypothetical protein
MGEEDTQGGEKGSWKKNGGKDWKVNRRTKEHWMWQGKAMEKVKGIGHTRGNGKGKGMDNNPPGEKAGRAVERLQAEWRIGNRGLTRADIFRLRSIASRENASDNDFDSTKR